MHTVTIEPEERSQLEALARTIKDAKTEKRILVILALADGYRIKDIARILRIDEDTVAKWRSKYAKRQFFTDWLREAYKGYSGKLSVDQERAIEAYISAETITDAATLVTYIQDHYRKTYTINGVTKLLHRLGFVYKQTTLIPGKLNETAQAAFKQEYEELRDTLPDDEVILFADGVHPSHNVHATKAWIKKGQEKQVPTNTGRKRLNINGVLNMETMETVTHFCKTINAETSIAFYDKVQATYRDKTIIYIIEDNARYYKNKDVQAYLDDPDCRIRIIWLPAYSPNLNFIERLWHFMKKYIIGTKRRETFKEFETDIHSFFENIGDYEQRLRQFIGTEMHLIKLNS